MGWTPWRARLVAVGLCGLILSACAHQLPLSTVRELCAMPPAEYLVKLKWLQVTKYQQICRVAESFEPVARYCPREVSKLLGILPGQAVTATIEQVGSCVNDADAHTIRRTVDIHNMCCQLPPAQVQACSEEREKVLIADHQRDREECFPGNPKARSTIFTCWVCAQQRAVKR
jgi:hypothetical protein